MFYTIIRESLILIKQLFQLLEPYEDKPSYTFSRGGVEGGIVVYLSQRATYRIVAIDVKSRSEGRALQELSFYNPMNKNETRLIYSAIVHFLELGAQPTETVHGIFRA